MTLSICEDCRVPGVSTAQHGARHFVQQMLSMALRFFASGGFMYSAGDAEQLNKATESICVTSFSLTQRIVAQYAVCVCVWVWLCGY